jgi:hypothetical protein
VQSSDRVRMGRRALGPVGVFLPTNPGAGLLSADVQRDAARRLERAGYQSVWNNEGVGGKDGLVQLGMLLAATERMTFGSAIANIWARSPQTAHGAAATLAEAYRGFWRPMAEDARAGGRDRRRGDVHPCVAGVHGERAAGRRHGQDPRRWADSGR